MMTASMDSPSPTGFGWRARFKAAGIHLALSAMVAGLAGALVFGVWYPMPFREISGGRELFQLIVAVDVILGPLITFAVFNRRKPVAELRRDLLVVVLLQLSALAYGLYTVAQARPVVLAFEVDRLRVLTPADLAQEDLSKAPEGLRELPWWGRHIVAAKLPPPEERLESLEQALAGRDIGQRPELWMPPEATGPALRAGIKPIGALQAKHADRAAELQQAIAATGLTADQLGYLPLVARQGDWVALIDTRSAQIVGYAPFDGF
jgi:hypothetical protein